MSKQNREFLTCLSNFCRLEASFDGRERGEWESEASDRSFTDTQLFPAGPYKAMTRSSACKIDKYDVDLPKSPC